MVFFAKGTFWTAYRWIGTAWAVIAVMMSIAPEVSRLLFGGAAALTCGSFCAEMPRLGKLEFLPDGTLPCRPRRTLLIRLGSVQTGSRLQGLSIKTSRRQFILERGSRIAESGSLMACLTS